MLGYLYSCSYTASQTHCTSHSLIHLQPWHCHEFHSAVSRAWRYHYELLLQQLVLVWHVPLLMALVLSILSSLFIRITGLKCVASSRRPCIPVHTSEHPSTPPRLHRMSQKHDTFRENKFESWTPNSSNIFVLIFTFVIFPAWFMKTFKEEQTLRDTVMRNRESYKFIAPRSSDD